MRNAVASEYSARNRQPAKGESQRGGNPASDAAVSIGSAARSSGSHRLAASIAVFLTALFARAIWAHHATRFTPQGVASDWGEVGNIAINLFHGRGFSDPFGIGSTPTAWECPAIPFVFAAIMKIAGGVNVQAAQIILYLQCVVGAAGVTTFWLVIRKLIDANPSSFARWLSPAVAVTVCFWPGSVLSAACLWDYVWQEAALALFL